ncbi:hypothetical protein [Luteimonas lutimaris]|uniref:Uncharacterized protein n=1 Tax=Luteimonas lutimaris TaxID=698645 RepID=A0ABP7MPL4_9GAMM
MDSNNNAPKPGTAEYDEAMIAKYRGQGAREAAEAEEGRGRRMGITEAVPHGGHDGITATDGRMGLSIRHESTLGPDFGRGRIDPGQAIDMRAEIDRLYEQLREVAGHDPRTGDPIPRVQGPGREARTRRLVMLESQLPLLEQAIEKQRIADADPDAPPRPGTFEALLAEKQRQDEVRARAEQIAFEREAEAMADRVAKQNKANRG